MKKLKLIEKELGLIEPNKNNTITNLYKKVQKLPPDIQPHIKTGVKGKVYQADILYLPHDNEFKYCLVVVDTFDNSCDAEPLKTRESGEVAKALQKIFKRKYLKTPVRIQCDAGNEFKGDVKKYCADNGITLYYSRQGRHKQTGLVEYFNKILGEMLFKTMLVNELNYEQENTSWTDDLPKIIKLFNEHLIKDKSKIVSDETIFQKSLKSKDAIVPIGTNVRYALDNPVNANGKQTDTKFRKTDVRWSMKSLKVVAYHALPTQPIRFILEGIPDCSFGRNEIQIVKSDEYLPKSNLYKVEKILSKKKINNKIHYEVKWVGYKKTTFEPRTNLIKQVPDLIKKFEEKE